MRDQGFNAQVHQGGRGNRHHDDVGGCGGNAAAHQNTDQAGHDQSCQQGERIDRHPSSWNPAAHESRNGLRSLRDDVADLEPHPREGDDANHNAHRGGSSAHCEGVFGAGFKRLNQDLRLDASAHTSPNISSCPYHQRQGKQG